MDIVHDLDRDAEDGMELGSEVRAAPARHHIVCIGDIAGRRIDDAAGRDADAEDPAISCVDDTAGRLDGMLQHDLAATLRLGRHLPVKRYFRTLALLEGHESRCNLRAADIKRDYLPGFSHGASFRKS